MWDNLPTEITTLILLKLPVKTLIVCTSLSKSFFSLITTHEFINTRIARNPTTHFFLRYLTIDRNDTKKCKEMYHLQPDNDNFTGFQNEGLSVPFDSNVHGVWFNVVGCVNGVICLVNDCQGEGTLIILWNPSIRKYVHVPEPHYVFQSYGGYESACGFDFDSVTNDYKVVRVVRLFDRDSEETVAEIYSLKSGCWRKVVGITPKYLIKRSHKMCYYFTFIPCFFNGSVHWVAYWYVSFTECENVILKFDLSKETFEIMEVPIMLKKSLLGFGTDYYVLECKGMLTLIRWNYAENVKTCCAWVMKEYGSANSWTKMIKYEFGNGFSRIPRAFGFRNNGEVIILKHNMVVSFNPATHGETMLGKLSANYIEPVSYYLCAYVESMVLFTEGKGIDDHTKKTVKSDYDEQRKW